MSVKALQGFRCSILMLIVLLSSCSIASDRPPTVTTSSAHTTIITHEVKKETDFFVKKQTILGADGKSGETDSGMWHDDNRTLVGYFTKHSIDISSCDYEVSVKSHLFKFSPEQESLVAYQYSVVFSNCPQVAERLSKLERNATLDSTHKHPSTLYLLSQAPLSIVSLYGMPTYYPSNVVESVLKNIAQTIEP